MQVDCIEHVTNQVELDVVLRCQIRNLYDLSLRQAEVKLLNLADAFSDHSTTKMPDNSPTDILDCLQVKSQVVSRPWGRSEGNCIEPSFQRSLCSVDLS